MFFFCLWRKDPSGLVARCSAPCEKKKAQNKIKLNHRHRSPPRHGISADLAHEVRCFTVARAQRRCWKAVAWREPNCGSACSQNVLPKTTTGALASTVLRIPTSHFVTPLWPGPSCLWAHCQPDRFRILFCFLSQQDQTSLVSAKPSLPGHVGSSHPAAASDQTGPAAGNSTAQHQRQCGNFLIFGCFVALFFFFCVGCPLWFVVAHLFNGWPLPPRNGWAI